MRVGVPAAAPLPAREIRVLVVDDSIFMRHTLQRLLSRIPGVSVIGTAADGIEAVKLVLELRPEVITMDVDLPRMEGLAAVAEIMKTLPTPIVMVSTMTAAGAETTLRALEAGAVEFITKPGGVSHELADVSAELAEAVNRASLSHVQRKRPMALQSRPPQRAGSTPVPGVAADHLIVIGASTGGPPALTEVIPRFGGDLSASVLVVQHMPAGFTAALARRLDALSALHVIEAADGDVLSEGRVLVAPGDFHITVDAERRVRLDRRPPLHGVRPSIDLTLESLTPVYGSSVSVAILTGMGRDGADGCVRIEEAGGRVITQDEATSVVYGMPRVARERTRHSREAPIDQIAGLLASTVSTQR
jgi:two-component system chemotaxis response regulator CheB